MMTYLLKRLLLIIPTLVGITIITFLMIQLAPGNPISLKLQQLGGTVRAESVSPEVIAQTKKLYGLDRPLPLQYLLWVKRLATLDFGVSYKDHRPVLDKISEALPVTLLLNVISIFLIYLISIPLGLFSAVAKESWLDRSLTLFLFFLYSLPSFWVAMLLIIYLGGGEYLDLFPIVGIVSPGVQELPFWGQVGNLIWHLVLPVTVLTYGGFAFLSRLSRAQLLEVIGQDFIRTARAKGLSERVVLFRHALRNSLIPLVTLMGTLLPAMIGGSVIVEQIFSIPGMGRLGFEAVLSRDYPTVMAIATIEAVLTLVGMLISDLLYVMVDPRISFEGMR
ncbi:MAG: ABC transporter permease [Deltaproteobacteria bacterium]|nr:ABC transporter permease [Deltaproteobacteria bacterium]MBI4374752.1 ABC transporter permease [Deltaproteobacteria bacterium]